MSEYRPLTVEHVMAQADRAREEGYEELAETFEGLAANIARFNETHDQSIEEVRKMVGEERFWRAWKQAEARRRLML